MVFDLDGHDDLRVVVLPGEVARSASDLVAAIADRLATVAIGDGSSVSAPDRSEFASDEGAVLLWRADRIARIAAGLNTRVVVMIDGIGSVTVAHTVFGQLRNELWEMEAITWVLGGASAHRGRYLEPPAEAFWESVIELGAAVQE